MPNTGRSIERILLIRNDRIGDLVLTTPAISVVAKSFPQARIDLLCSCYAEPVVRGNPWLHEVITDCGAHDRSDLQELVELLAPRRYSCAVTFVHSYKNARLVHSSGIPLRIGPLVRWYSPLFFNRAIRQKRSRAERHEALYNLELLSPLGIEVTCVPPPLVIPSKEAVGWSGGWLQSEFGEKAKLPLVVVHPGMGGSALNWPERFWRELVGLLERESGCRVLVTGSQDEAELVRRVTGDSLGSKRVRSKVGMSLEHFIGLLSRADAVVAPSTGPLHLAGALGVTAVGIYSPVRAHHPNRWGPLGKGKSKVFLPPVDCPGILDCLLERCAHFPCMELIEPVKVLGYLRRVLAG